MNGSILLIVVVAVFFLVSGIQLWRGKWLNLIAGYNTMSKKEKRQVNDIFVGRAVGTLMLFCAAAILVMLIFPQAIMVVAALIVVAVIVVIVFINGSKSVK